MCPVDAITSNGAEIIFDDKCTECGLCAQFCPVGAIKPDKKRGGR